MKVELRVNNDLDNCNTSVFGKYTLAFTELPGELYEMDFIFSCEDTDNIIEGIPGTYVCKYECKDHLVISEEGEISASYEEVIINNFTSHNDLIIALMGN